MRAPGLTWFRLPLFVWSHYATSLIMILGTPVIAITLLLLVLERNFHIGIFDPQYGGDPVLFQHLFWFYSHPAVYIMILPGMGVISEIIAAFCRKRIFGYKFVAFSSLGIAIIGFLVWGHHMFIAAESIFAATVFSVISMLVAVPSAIKVFNWTATLYKASVSLGNADALRPRVHRPVHHRRADRSDAGGHRYRRPRDRHLLRDRALSLRDGRRRDPRLPRRPALLVAQDHRPHVLRVLVQARRADRYSSASTSRFSPSSSSATSGCRAAITPTPTSGRY